MKNKWIYLVLAVVFLFVSVMPNRINAVSAQAPQPPELIQDPPSTHPCLMGEPCAGRKSEKLNTSDEISSETMSIEPLATGGPDEYGYIWDDTEPFAWIDARAGTETDLSGDDNYQQLDVGFSFKFYENTYTQLFANTNGLITFQEDGAYSWSNTILPNSSSPNNLIATFWDDLCVNYGSYNGGRVYYHQGGVSPNRYFVVEWYQISRLGSTDLLTFEVILHESGDIVIQYLALDGYLTSSTVGIEDSMGLDGLLYLYNSSGLINNKAIRFSYPSSTARVRVSPLYQGDFTSSGEVDEFVFTVSNTGDLGPDTYDMDVTLAPSGTLWTASLFDALTGDPLTDTDGDSKIDTGAIPQGANFDVLVKVTAPAGQTVGAGIKTLIDVTSSLNSSKNKTVTLESTIPSAFAQTYRDYDSSNLDTDLIWPGTQLNVEMAQDHWNIDQPAIVETPDHNFVHVWSEWEWADNGAQGYVLKYAVMDKLGREVQPAADLTSLYGSPNSYTYDGPTSLAVTPDGKIGVLWTRFLHDYATNLWNYNVWFAVLTQTGGLAYGPVNLTNNNQWGSDPQGGHISYSLPKIEASTDNRFMLAWEILYYHEPTGTQDSDLYYMIRNSSGSALTGLINMTADVENAAWYGGLSLTTLTGNKFYIVYQRVIRSGSNYYGYNKYRVINSSGSLVVGENSPDHRIPEDSIQLPNGNIFLGIYAWNSSTGNYEAGYAVINGTNYSQIASGSLSHPSNAEMDYSSISVTKSPDGKAIMTWMDSNNKYLYYALFHASGTLLSGPVIFNYFENGASINYEGQSITTNTWQPNSGLDVFSEFSSPLYGAAPGGAATIQVDYANQGLTTAANPSLTLTLAEGLTYSYDTSGLTPTVFSNTVTWDLPDLAFADGESFMVYVSVPSDAVIGTRYDISLAITSDGTDVDLSNNADAAEIMAANLLFLPMIMK